MKLSLSPTRAPQRLAALSVAFLPLGVCLALLLATGACGGPPSGGVADDDGCTSTRCADVAPPAPPEASDAAAAIVGPNGLIHPFCAPANYPLPNTAGDSFARYVRGDTGEVCTAVLITQDSKALVSTRCRSAVRGVLGQIEFQAYPSTCDVASAPSTDLDVYPVTAEGVAVDAALGLMVVQLGVRPSDLTTAAHNHFGVRFGTTKGASTHLTVPGDELFTVALGTDTLLADPHCGVTAVGAATHTCDSRPALGEEPAKGGGVLYHRSNCIPVGVGTACQPGTGPQSPGAQIGRLVGVSLGSNASGQNELVYASALTCTGCLLGPFLTPGNFIP